ncbi:hypothetical protein S1OALGB6SA_1680 [Olavius algarvensis spirochete endosymbiont]|nr:hypothetical protein S1OALGB6SA_1680 [Olavius algarvensis spirochete endosymbiont]
MGDGIETAVLSFLGRHECGSIEGAYLATIVVEQGAAFRTTRKTATVFENNPFHLVVL